MPNTSEIAKKSVPLIAGAAAATLVSYSYAASGPMYHVLHGFFGANAVSAFGHLVGRTPMPGENAALVVGTMAYAISSLSVDPASAAVIGIGFGAVVGKLAAAWELKHPKPFTTPAVNKA